jgi:hypothetical protein
MAAMAFIFEFYNPVVERVQLVLQMLNFVLKREAGILSACFPASTRIASRLPVLARRVVMSWLLRSLTKRGRHSRRRPPV